MEGWIKLHRKFEEWEWASDPCVSLVFIRLIMAANYRDSAFKGQTVLRGQCVIGLRSFSKKIGMPFQTFRTALKRLQSTGEIALSPTRDHTTVTICNYGIYQTDKIETNTLPTHEPTHKSTHELTRTKDGATTSFDCESSESARFANTPINTPPNTQTNTIRRSIKNVDNTNVLSTTVPFGDVPHEPPKPKKTSKPKGPPIIDWPKALDTPENRQAFQNFKAHRKNSGRPMSKQQAELFLGRWTFPPADFAKSCEESIAEGFMKIVHWREVEEGRRVKASYSKPKSNNGHYEPPPAPRPQPPEWKPRFEPQASPETAAKCKAKIAELIKGVGKRTMSH